MEERKKEKRGEEILLKLRAKTIVRRNRRKEKEKGMRER